MATNRGNVLFIILIAVALFAALSFAITSGGGNTGARVDREKIIIEAAKIMEYSNAVKETVGRLTVTNTCKDTQVSFESDHVPGYENAHAPPGKTCFVFDAGGGAVNWEPRPAITGVPLEFEFHGTNAILGIGSVSPDLVMFLPINSKELCIQINKSLGLPERMAVDWFDNRKYNGDYVTINQIPDDGGNIDGYTSQWAACIEAKSEGKFYPKDAGADYFFYKVLIAR